MDHIDGLLEEWFPGLLEEQVTGKRLVHRLVPCVKCKSDTLHCFKLETLVAASEKAEEVTCPNHSDKVQLSSLVRTLLPNWLRCNR